ncbi:hypothetical protein [Neobacillus sp. FSL H8-0543]|uniref:hypothetical protein n=1 Tax=Neobacillus sp. FSL H8-0543 TaxID=2954672 RepID=UPI003158F440
MKFLKSDCCSPLLVGTTETDRIAVGYNLACGQQSSVLYEAVNMERFPTVTAITRLSGSENPCIDFSQRLFLLYEYLNSIVILKFLIYIEYSFYYYLVV